MAEQLRLVPGLDREVALWIIARVKDIVELPGGYVALGIVRGDNLVGGALFTNYRPVRGGADIEVWTAGDGPWLSRRIVNQVFAYPFGQLKCHRVTALVRKTNKPSRNLLDGLGFRLDGVAREGYGPQQHACIYSLLKSDWQQSKLYKDYGIGQIHSAVA